MTGKVTFKNRGKPTDFNMEVYAVWPDGTTKFGYDIDVYTPRTDPFAGRTEMRPAKVNWGGLGSQMPEDAVVFGELVKRAARLAMRLNKKAGVTAQ